MLILFTENEIILCNVEEHNVELGEIEFWPALA